MEDGGPLSSIVLLIALIIIEAYYYMAIVAIREMNLADVTKKAHEVDKKSSKLLKLMEQPVRLFNTFQLLAIIVAIIIGYRILPQFNYWLIKIIDCYMPNIEYVCIIHLLLQVIIFFVIVLFVLMLGILIPKQIGVKWSNRCAYSSIHIVSMIYSVLSPIAGFITSIARLILRMFKIDANVLDSDVTEEEILSMVNEGHEQGVLLDSEAKMIANIFQLGDKHVEDIMTHRSNIVGIDCRLSLDDAITFMLSQKNSRYPVYDENIDNIKGILHLKDALRNREDYNNGGCIINDIEDLFRVAKFIPEKQNVDLAFKNMQLNKLQMSIVVDEYGQTAGLIAMEDILEEIVGNILDEYDEEEVFIRDIGNNKYVVEGLTPLKILEDRFGIDFEDSEFDTLNGYLISRMDKIPEADESYEIEVAKYIIKVIKVDNMMIKTALLSKIESSQIDDCESV